MDGLDICVGHPLPNLNFKKNKKIKFKKYNSSGEEDMEDYESRKKSNSVEADWSSNDYTPTLPPLVAFLF